ncbi:MAG: NAD(P)-dependent oxidoreductase [Clostridiales bacterium]|nr:NAD(P)-dependent oxidoreductase [Clostridiales bacterium]
MKILVTDGNGFIGKAFIKKYDSAFDIVLPGKDVDFLDARSVDALIRSDNFDAVLHLANVPEKADGSFIESDNLIMFHNLQYVCTKYGVKKLIVVSDAADFDRSQELIDVTEEMAEYYVPSDGYGLARSVINTLAAKDKITTVLRVFDIYGGMGNTPLNKIAAAAMKGKKKIVLDCERTVSTVAIDDLTKIIAAFLKGDYPKGDYNVVCDEKTTFLTVAKAMRRAVRRDEGDIDIELKSEHVGLEHSASNSKLLSVLPFRLTPIGKGIKTLCDEAVARRK